MKFSGLTLALSLLVITQNIASAQDATNSTTTSRRTVIDSNGNSSSTTTVTTTNAGAISSGALYSVLDNRRYELDRMIGDAKLRGTIDESTATQLQSKCDHVRLLMLDRAALNQDLGIKIARELDVLDNDVAVALKVTALTPLTVVDSSSGSAQFVTDQVGNVIAISEAQPDMYIKTLEGRRLELEGILAAGQASGTISSAQARNLRAELDRTAKMQAAEQSNNLTYVNVLPVAMSYDYIGNQLTTVVPSISYVPLVNGRRFVIVGGRVILLDDVMVRRAELESKIARDFANGKISSRQVSLLRNELSKIAVMEKQMRAKGSLTFKDSRALYNRFDVVGSRLDRYQA